MPNPEKDDAALAPAPVRARKTISAILVIALAIGVCWLVEKRSGPPPPPHIVLPYDPPPK